jgi:hypothetical protein
VKAFRRAAEVELLAEDREIPKLAKLDRDRNGGEACDLPQMMLSGLLHVVFPAHNFPWVRKSAYVVTTSTSRKHAARNRGGAGANRGAPTAARNRGGAGANRGAPTAAGSRPYSEVDVTSADSVSLARFG